MGMRVNASWRVCLSPVRVIKDATVWRSHVVVSPLVSEGVHLGVMQVDDGVDAWMSGCACAFASVSESPTTGLQTRMFGCVRRRSQDRAGGRRWYLRGPSRNYITRRNPQKIGKRIGQRVNARNRA